MSVPEILKSIGERFESSATVKNVYGEPVSAEGRTIIPVASISYGFGGGGSAQKGEQGTGGGGGGSVSAIPIGVIEITSEGTLFIPILNRKKLALGLAAAFVVGFVIGTRRGHV